MSYLLLLLVLGQGTVPDIQLYRVPNNLTCDAIENFIRDNGGTYVVLTPTAGMFKLPVVKYKTMTSTGYDLFKVSQIVGAQYNDKINAGYFNRLVPGRPPVRFDRPYYSPHRRRGIFRR